MRNEVKSMKKEIDFSKLANCFDYKVCNDHSVILKLKEELEPFHLLQFDGFLCGYSMFKIEKHGYNGTFTMIRDENETTYWTVTWGHSTTMTTDYVWKMRDALLECIREKCDMWLGK